jgi:zinc protease
VETELAVSVYGGMQVTQDPFLYTINTIVHPESKAEKVLQALDEQIIYIQENKPPGDSLDRAMKQARALFAYGSESITNQAFWLGISEMVASYEWFVNFLDMLTTITPEDVQRVAQTYLRPQNRVVGTYLPVAKGYNMDNNLQPN